MPSLPHASRAPLVTVVLLALVLAACDATPPNASSPAKASGSLRASVVPSPRPTVPPTATPSPSPTLAGSTIPPLASGPDALALEPFASGLREPIGITNAGDGSGRLYVNERGGAIRLVEPDGTVRPEPFVDLSALITAGGEQGLLGLAFHPDFAANGRLFVYYTAAGDGANTLAELRATASRQRARPDTLRVLFAIPDPFGNHNAGQLAFGPDGFLYVGLGDGGAGGDPLESGQDPNALLGKILRLDVDTPPPPGATYAIPPSNPFATEGAQPGAGAPEVWAMGLRNPWRFSFDPQWGDLYIADVGQGSWEEIDRQPGDSAGGENYGWDVMEGRSCFIAADCDQRPYVKPIAQYRTHEAGTCAVVGGHVYRGAAQPELDGVYVFGDYCSGSIFTLQVDEGTTTVKVVHESGRAVSSFGVAEDGEIYVADLEGGALLRVVVPD
ncbi:MAG TPA: PQQ-dependent sugar dehydrogenase [Candidatus Limnocylindria bacterium]|nr:PQQ-dependent sugar dehydrogenase [Candidatus Limnocylindria bacterium]